MIRALLCLGAFTFACTFSGHSAAAQRPTSVPAGESTPAAEPEPTPTPALMKDRAYAIMRFGRIGSSTLRTSETEYEGTPNHVFGIGLRGELPVLPNLSLGGDMLVSGVTGADLTERGRSAHIEYTPIDLGVVLTPRLPLAHGLVEARGQLMFGLGLLAFIEGEFQVAGQSPTSPYAFAEDMAVSGYFGFGLGATVWLSDHWSVFFELDVLVRGARATVKPGLREFESLDPAPKPKSQITIGETYGAFSFGVGWSKEGP